MLTNVTLRVDPGEAVAIMGPNGSGKSTLLQIMTGTQAPSAGDVFIMQRSMRRAPTSARRFIGYSPRYCLLVNYMTVRENLYYYGKVRSYVPNFW